MKNLFFGTLTFFITFGLSLFLFNEQLFYTITLDLITELSVYIITNGIFLTLFQICMIIGVFSISHILVNWIFNFDFLKLNNNNNMYLGLQNKHSKFSHCE